MGMPLYKTLGNTETVTFSDMAFNFLQHVMYICRQHRNIKQIHVVFDKNDRHNRNTGTTRYSGS